MDAGQGAVGHVAGLAAPGQVRGDFLEVFALVEGAQQLIGAHIEDVGVVGREVDRGLPVPAVGAFAQIGLGGDGFPLLAAGVDAEVVAELEARIDGVIVARVDGDLHAVAAEQAAVRVLAGLVPGGAGLVGARPHPNAVVLQAAIDAVGFSHVISHGIKLPHGRGVALDPVFAVVVGDIQPAIVAEQQVASALGADPQGMVVHVHIIAVDVDESLAPVVRAQYRHAQHKDFIGVERIDPQLAEVVAIGVIDVVEKALMGALPALAAIIGAINFQANDGHIKEHGVGVFYVIDQRFGGDFVFFHHAAHRFYIIAFRDAILLEVFLEEVFFQFEEIGLADAAQLVFGEGALLRLFLGAAVVVVDRGKEHRALARPDRIQADAAGAFAHGEATAREGEQGPAFPSVAAFVDARAGARFGEIPGAAAAFPGGGVEGVGVGGVHPQVDDPCIFADVERFGPGLPAISGFINAAFLVGGVEVPQGGDPGGLRVVGMQHDAANVVAFGQAKVLPGLAAIGAFINAGPGIRRAAGVVLARADPDDILAPVDGDVPDGHHHFLVK